MSKIVIGFSGHRPNKLGGYNYNSKENMYIMTYMSNEMIKYIESIIKTTNKIHCIFGGALGFDQMMFDTMCGVKDKISKKYKSIKFIFEIAIPYEDQPKNWYNKNDIERYHKQLEQADIVTYVDTLLQYSRTLVTEGKHDSKKLQIRNEFIVDNANILIAMFDGEKKGGTYNCIKYAKKKDDIEIKIYDPKEIIDRCKNKNHTSFFK